MPEYIDTAADLSSLLVRLREAPDRVCAIDTEADSLHRYKESLCLIQLSAAGENVLIDPLALNDLSPFDEYLNECDVWMHGADYDMTMLRREFGRIPSRVWDTQIGARLLGVRRFGLSDLVEHWFGVVLQKTSQKADWGLRPLTPRMLDYAINDVVYLMPLAECIVEELIDAGRYEWFVQSCDAARKKVMERIDQRDEAWRISGGGRLTPRGLAYLRALWHWRDAEAAEWDRPTFMIAGNKDLLAWAELLEAGQEVALAKHHRRGQRLQRFDAAIAAVGMMDESELPQKMKTVRRRKDADFDRALDVFLKKRETLAAELNIESSLIIARSTAESIVAGEVAIEESLLPWQRELLGL